MPFSRAISLSFLLSEVRIIRNAQNTIHNLDHCTLLPVYIHKLSPIFKQFILLASQ